MKNKTLVKAKIVLEDNGTGLVTYLWKKTWWIFGYWYPFGCTSSLGKLPDAKVKRITDDEVSSVLYDEFINHQSQTK